MRRIKEVSALYNKIYLNFKNLILLGLVLCVLIIVSYFNLDLGFDKSEFIFIRDDYIQNYLDSTISFIMIINCVIIPAIFLSELKEESNTISSILIPRVSKINLNTSKLLTALLIAIYYSIIEMLIVGVTPLIWYPNFVLKISFLKIGLFVILYSCFNAVVLLLLIKLFHIFIVDAIPLIIYLALNFAKENDKIKDYLPALTIINQSIESNNSLYIIFTLTMVVSILYLIIK